MWKSIDFLIHPKISISRCWRNWPEWSGWRDWESWILALDGISGKEIYVKNYHFEHTHSTLRIGKYNPVETQMRRIHHIFEARFDRSSLHPQGVSEHLPLKLEHLGPAGQGDGQGSSRAGKLGYTSLHGTCEAHLDHGVCIMAGWKSGLVTGIWTTRTTTSTWSSRRCGRFTFIPITPETKLTTTWPLLRFNCRHWQKQVA